jgi:hypothetical protein
MLQRLTRLCEDHGNPMDAREHLQYLCKRKEQMQYPTYRGQGWPIGSGVVESGNKVVMQSRLKGAGMHWKDTHVNPMFVLRTSLCNDRWNEMWMAQERHQRKQQYEKRLQHQRQPMQKRQEKREEIRKLVLPSLPPPRDPVPVPVQKVLKGRTEAQRRWGHIPFRVAQSSMGYAKL